MSDKMRSIPFKDLIHWIFEEFEQNRTIFGIHGTKFYQKKNEDHVALFHEKCENPIGPAAGPHTQLAQNIITAYLTGARFFELKTVQKLDELEFPKPCILAADEGYNTEWSTELHIQKAYEEYVKAWLILHLFQKVFNLSLFADRAFIFNMSVGYDLAGIKTEKVNTFIDDLIDASNNTFFKDCKNILKVELENGVLSEIADQDDLLRSIGDFIDGISPKICSSITLSTMHGCPPQEIEAICQYLLTEKKLHTYVKLNPTLLGYEFARNTFDSLGYDYISLKEESFTHDLQYNDAIEMLVRLQNVAKKQKLQFGVKLSNTLPVQIRREELPGEEMYMSGRALYPLTIQLAAKLSEHFAGELPISYSGGADIHSVEQLYQAGIFPITIATSLLKPGGYLRLNQIAAKLDTLLYETLPKVAVDKVTILAEEALENPLYKKGNKFTESRKIQRKLPQTDCYIAPCQTACPIGQDIPTYIHLVNEGKYKEALQVITAKNPLPHITGYICDHNCMFKCTRIDYDEPVLIRDMKRFAAEEAMEELLEKQKIKKNHIKTAIIGGGPAGLSTAYFLAKNGFDVTVYDKEASAGGMVQHGIPDFRLPQDVIGKDIDFIEQYGVKFEFNVDPVFSAKVLRNHNYKYIVLAIGAWKNRPLHLDINDGKLLPAIEFLRTYKKNPEEPKLGENVAIVGGGNSAMDSARAAKRVQGVKKVSILYRRTKEEMPADKEEFDNALIDGIDFLDLVLPVRFEKGVLTCQKMKLGDLDSSGRRKPVPIENEFLELPIDTVITAIGELVDYDILQTNGIQFDENGVIECDPTTLETNVENVFLAGDAYRGPATVVQAIADGTKVAKSIMKKENLTLMLEYPIDRKFSKQEIIDKKGNISVVTTSNDENYVKNESQRCLECDSLCNICTEVCPNRANVPIYFESDSFTNAAQIIHIDGMCNECGNCSVFCPYEGNPYKDKFTLFWSEEDFASSENEGFLLLDRSRQPDFKIRFKNEIFTIKFYDNGKIFSESDIASSDEFGKLSEIIWEVYQKHGYLFLDEIAKDI